MPGIAGLISDRPASDCRRDIEVMIASMRHDPSYVDQILAVDECHAYVGRVSHPGSFADVYSGLASDGLVLALSGECLLVESGATCSRNECDLLSLYRRIGPSFVKDLNGLFSGVLIDPGSHSVLLFNDRYASERIYFHTRGKDVYFASEAKALLTLIPELRALDAGGVAQYLAYGSTRDGVSLFRGIELLPGASMWTFVRGKPIQRGSYFDPREWESQEKLSEEAFEAEFVELVRSVVPMYCRGTSKIGISITGGLDTRMIMACLPTNLDSPVCYTYGALEGDTLDASIGRGVAQAMGLEHHTLRTSQEFVSNFPLYLDRTVFVTDGCLGALGAHEVYFSARARELAPVRLTGNYGSELLRGMTTAKPLRLAAGLLSSDGQKSVSAAIEHAGQDRHSLTRAAFHEIPMHLFGALIAARSQLVVRTPYLDNAIVKLAYRASEQARSSPAASLRLIETGNEVLGRMSTDRGFSCGSPTAYSRLRRLYCDVTFKLDYWDKEGLPASLSWFDTLKRPLGQLGLLGLHKFLPYRTWFRREFAVYISDVLASSITKEQPWWSAAFLETLGTDHVRGRHNYLRELNAVLTLNAIDRLLVRGLPRPGN